MRKTFKRDWRSPENYENLKNYSLDKWAWEFLRRNPEYCREYRELTKGLTTKVKRKMAAHIDRGCRKWEIQVWMDPDKEYFNIPFIEPGGTEAVILYMNSPTRKGVEVQWAGEETGEVLFRFDTRKPINPQIEAAKKELLKLQRNQSGERQAIFKPRTFGNREEWIFLLRVLDATAEGIKPKAIAEVFYPNEEITSTKTDLIKQISDKIKQAKRYTSHNYRLIPFLAK